MEEKILKTAEIVIKGIETNQISITVGVGFILSLAEIYKELKNY